MSREQIDRHLFGPGPKRILSIDGGGVHGLAALGILKRVQTLLASRSPEPDRFKLSDYFDLIGGTSTGAVIATMLAFGFRVERIIWLYKAFCPAIFGKPRLLNQFFMASRFDSSIFEDTVNKIFDNILREKGRHQDLQPKGEVLDEPTLGSDLLETGLAVVAKRIDRPSIWVLSNNPRSKYWDEASPLWSGLFKARGESFMPNRDYSLRSLVRASASAPFYLDAVEVQIDKKQRGLFLDGGVSPHNNPSTELFLMATVKADGADGVAPGLSPFGFSWETGADNLFMLSIGTGRWREVRSPGQYNRILFPKKPFVALSSIISDCVHSGVTWMQALSEPRIGEHINVNLEDMRGLKLIEEPLLSYRRVNPRFEKDWLEGTLLPAVKLAEEELRDLRNIDNADPDNMERLLAIGEATGEQFVSAEDFPSAFDLPEWATYKAPAMKRFIVGITGHRPNRLPNGSDPRLLQDLDQVLAAIEAKWPGRRFILVTGLAEGADRLAAAAAIKRGWRLEAILPFTKERYLEDFQSEASKADFERLLASADRVLELSSGDRFQGGAVPDAYAALGDEMVERSDAVIAVWDGKPAQGKGGTVDVMAAALAARTPVYWINAATSTAPRRLKAADLPS